MVQGTHLFCIQISIFLCLLFIYTVNCMSNPAHVRCVFDLNAVPTWRKYLPVSLTSLRGTAEHLASSSECCRIMVTYCSLNISSLSLKVWAVDWKLCYRLSFALLRGKRGCLCQRSCTKAAAHTKYELASILFWNMSSVILCWHLCWT